MSDVAANNPRVFFAAERTLLAWIRTGLALMGFGFVVSRFGIFLQALLMDHGGTAAEPSSVSVGLGVSLVAAGVVVCLVAAWQYILLVRTSKSGASLTLRPSVLGVALALGLGVAGLVMTVYLIHTRSVSWESNRNQRGSTMQTQNDTGIVSTESAYSVDETAAKLQALLQQRHITLFALVDHSGEAAKAGMKMPPTKLLIFGNPKAGTPVMLAAPGSAIDLPLKLLVWQDADGKTRLSYNDPRFLRDRHHIPNELMQNLSVVEVLAAQAGQ